LRRGALAVNTAVIVFSLHPRRADAAVLRPLAKAAEF